jgi:predicted MFS family arabinose efflux permease
MDRTAIVLILLGIALAAVSGLADTVGLGDDQGFHYRQAIGVGVGAVLVVAGVVVALRRSRRGPEQDAAPPTRESGSTR